MTYHHSKHETCIVVVGTCMYNCPTFFLFWECLDDMSYWTNLYRTVADNEPHFFHNFKLELYSFCEPCPYIYVIKKGIHGWAGHIARFNYNRWTKRVTECTPREWTRRQGIPKTIWTDNLFRHLGPAWPIIARDRRLWKQFMERFLIKE